MQREPIYRSNFLTCGTLGVISLRAISIGLFLVALAWGQAPDSYEMYSSSMPAGSIGKRQLKHGRVPVGKVQPIKISGPAGTTIAAANAGSFASAYFTPAMFGVEVGHIYRFKLTEIPNLDGVELYPSVEMIGYLSPPPGKERDFPVPIVFTIEDLRIAAKGGFVTRVVYVEDPDMALPGMQEDQDQSYFEVGLGEDPLHVAEVLGRPVAIVRIGSKTPATSGPNDRFSFQSPDVQEYSASRRSEPTLNFGLNNNHSKIQQVNHVGPVERPRRLDPKPANLAPRRTVKNRKSSYRQPAVPAKQQSRPARPRAGGPVPFAPASRQLIERSK